jgi:hypothetical protein
VDGYLPPTVASLRKLRRLTRREAVDAGRRRASMAVDQGWALLRHGLDPPDRVASDGPTRLSLITVNFSTTHYLKLMLLTLCQQERLGIVDRIVLVDNRSRDGGEVFARRLEAQVPRLHVVENRHFLNHARGMRAGVRRLDRADRDAAAPADVLLFCDPDVVFRHPTTLIEIARRFHDDGVALLGEWRPRRDSVPNIQASFLAVSRQVHARRDIRPLVHHGSPAYWQQQSIWRAGLPVENFPSNHGGHVLHRGRSGVAAAREHLSRHPYARVGRYAPHYMGVPRGEQIWSEVEARHQGLLTADAEPACIDVLATALSQLGSDALGEGAEETL